MKTLENCFVSTLILASFVIFSGALNRVSAQETCTGNQIFTQKSCAGDGNSSEEKALFEFVNKYRMANGRATIRLSASLSILANRRMLDLRQNLKVLTHSWSNCPYDIKDEKTWPCTADAPARLKTGYKGQGYETLYRTATGTASPTLALDAWKKSTLHNSIILNQGIFKDIAWDEVGVAIDGQFAALWFGSPGSGVKTRAEAVIGLGVSYEQAVAGLAKILSIDQTSSTVENNKWQGFSADKKIKLEIHGSRSDISEANMGIAVKLEPNLKLSGQNQIAIATLLKNLFPEWPDREAWLESSVAAISKDRTVSKTKLVRKIAIEMRSDGPNEIKLSVKPAAKPSYVEVFD